MRWIGSTCAGAAVALSLLLCVPAAFAGASPRVASAPQEGHLRRGFGASDSTNWSGYAAYGTTFASVQGNWIQPRANCEAVSKHGFAIAAFWVGLDGYENKTVEQTGTEADCAGSAPVYRAWWELYPKASVLIGGAVNPGDRMHAQVTQGELVLQDLTAEWTFKKSFLPGSLAFGSAEWIAEAPARNALTDFGSVRFSSATAGNGVLSGGIESGAWSDDAITLIGGSPIHPTVLATPGALEEEAGAFTIQQSAAGATHGRSQR